MLYSDSTPLIHKTNKAVASKVTAFLVLTCKSIPYEQLEKYDSRVKSEFLNFRLDIFLFPCSHKAAPFPSQGALLMTR